MNATEKVWTLFNAQSDPRLRSYMLHRLARFGVDPAALMTQLIRESDDSIRRSLILGLGEFAKAKLFTTEQQTALTADVAKLYADDPDSGIHGPAEWSQEPTNDVNPVTVLSRDSEHFGILSNSGLASMRGGSFVNVAVYARSASRHTFQPNLNYVDFGFRVARTLPPASSTAQAAAAPTPQQHGRCHGGSAGGCKGVGGLR